MRCAIIVRIAAHGYRSGSSRAKARLRCAYHGWRFAGDGECLAAPLNELNAAALKKCRATALPIRKIGGAIWIFTATDPEHTEAPEPQLPESLTGDPERFVTYEQHWDAHWTRAQENFIDFAHPPYLHQSTIGAWLHDYAEHGGTARVDAEDTDWGMIMTSYVGDGRRRIPVALAPAQPVDPAFRPDPVQLAARVLYPARRDAHARHDRAQTAG